MGQLTPPGERHLATPVHFAVAFRTMADGNGYWVDGGGRAHDEQTGKVIARAATATRTRILSPSEARSRGAPYGTPWTPTESLPPAPAMEDAPPTMDGPDMGDTIHGAPPSAPSAELPPSIFGPADANHQEPQSSTDVDSGTNLFPEPDALAIAGAPDSDCPHCEGLPRTCAHGHTYYRVRPEEAATYASILGTVLANRRSAAAGRAIGLTPTEHQMLTASLQEVMARRGGAMLPYSDLLGLAFTAFLIYGGSLAAATDPTETDSE